MSDRITGLGVADAVLQRRDCSGGAENVGCDRDQ